MRGDLLFTLAMTAAATVLMTANELRLIRRINLSGEPFREDPPEANTGAPIGHWNGRTLVVETRGLDHDIGWDEPRNHMPIRIGRHVHIVERFSLIEPEKLQIVARITAPDLHAAAYEVTTVYSRDRSHRFQQMTNCVQNDRAFDDSTGRERSNCRSRLLRQPALPVAHFGVQAEAIPRVVTRSNIGTAQRGLQRS